MLSGGCGRAVFNYPFLTQKERDNETGLDYFVARYYASTQGRFTSVDPLIASARTTNPQTFNRYAYTLNNPLRYVDPTGLMDQDPADYKPEFRPCTVGVEAGCSERDTVLGSVTINISQEDSIIDSRAAEVTPTLSLPMQDPGSVDPLPGINAPLIGAGTAAGFGEFDNVRFGQWRGPNNRQWYPMSHQPNGATGARSLAQSRAGGFRLFGRFVFAVSAFNTLYQGADAYEHGDRQGVFNAGTDLGMGVLGTFGGPVGFVGNTVYTVDRVIYPNDNPFNARNPTITNVTPFYMPLLR